MPERLRGKARWALPMFALVLGLTGCSAQEASEGDAAPGLAPSANMPSPTAPPAMTPLPLAVEALDAAALSGTPLEGELGCSFAPSRGGQPLFVGRGYVDPAAVAQGLAKIDGRLVKLTMKRPGGYDAMSDGGRFTAGNTVLAIAVAAGGPLAETPAVAAESPVHGATMTVAWGDRTAQIDGFYECGP